ncbi:hypothetical protein FACS1894191_5990 [Clostridia bacterium]|nr:hypothetical protein FACS1894191_5990 [Clostridia bacterium]
MKFCEHCGVKIANPMERCPLCYSALARADKEPEAPAYPSLAGRAEKYNIVYRMLLFLSITAGGCCLVVNIVTFKNYWWSLIVIANILYMWITIRTMIREHTPVSFSILTQAISLSLLLLTIDYLTGYHRWALNYAAPVLFVTAMLCITIVVIVKRVAIGRFVLYFFLIALLGFIPITLMAFGFVTVLWPSLASAVYSAISLVSIFIFADNATKIELKKRFHI